MPARTSSPTAPPGLTLPATPLTLVTGKGGVGRSSTATALAMALAGRGARVALVYPVDAVPVRPPLTAPTTLKVVPLDRDEALLNYLGDQLPGPFVGALRLSRAFKLLTAATPGLAELLTIGELRRMIEGPYDHLVFDAPATGHLMAMFDAPGRFERAAAVGPVARRAKQLGEWIVDPAVVTTVSVTTGDSLAVSELLDLVGLLEGRMGRGPDLVVANRLAPISPAGAELEALTQTKLTVLEAEAVRGIAARSRSERAQLARITKALGTAPLKASERPGDAVSAIGEALAQLDGVAVSR